MRPISKICMALLAAICFTSTLSAQFWHQYAYPDAASTVMDNPVVIHVLDNDDLFPSLTAMNYIANPVACDYDYIYGVLSSKEGGTLVILAKDSIRYTPPAGFTGVDEFLYGICNDTVPLYATDTARVTVTVTGGTGVAAAAMRRFTCSPNPAREAISLTGLPSQLARASYRITDAAGRLVGEGVLEGMSLPVASLRPGLHFLQLIDGETAYTSSFLVQ